PIDAPRGLGEVLNVTPYFDEQALRHWRSHLHAVIGELCPMTPADVLRYYDFVTQWLDPPADDLKGDLLDGYWERRWIAVNSIGQMPDATDAIPKLESLQAEPNARLWVNTHVPRVLGVLRENDQ
ncbi:hypothetical protein, partial [Rhodopirellula bahusiensis]|uniref:hypothetical protein n=2 Tax=Rhodopirellula bahusiensis TaxID=2014065 RepID=UPI003267E136